ncbi:MAG: ABC transporter ATP-binding protein [Planctomycetaceae bacterium]|nr:ABC transporter ATP-binding protein [Planctomycetaceae bacterium]MCP4463649.1 ABC transporter ATP-binding protein [Planctomycetaceae bacterium]MDG1808687.1 ABC transporter ATP-binding protein [Pirellulaceae bacterium]MDG2105109.1 ABC transporter ATP-binding protein [Pirellulaceae bacterium]
MLKLDQIKKQYRQPNGETLSILDVPAYQVAAGEQVALIGPSGCGKTTMLHVIAGITKPTSGRVVLDGVELSKYSESARDRIRADKIGYVFQTFNLLPGFNALENVVLGMTFARGKRDTARARKLLERVGLSHRISHHPSKMSVGEQQRVAVARALANRPKLLLADEPTANVDPQNQQQIVDLIRKTCQEENIALILVTHSREVSDQFERIDLLSDVNQVVARALAKNEAK